MANCTSCRLQLEKYLCDLPSKWRDQIIDVICNYIDNQEFPCDKIKECLANEVGTLDPKCLAEPGVWAELSYLDQMQLIIYKVCSILDINELHIESTPAITLAGDGSEDTPLSATLELSADAGNSAEIRDDGLWVPTGISAEDLCGLVPPTFSTDANQKNTVTQTDYDFMITGSSGCEKVSPPLGFAVSGNTRKSAFGSMEWYSTLAAANTAATSGETVLLYNDASGEDLTPKTGVNYFGIGQKKIGNLNITSGAYVGNISNITVTGNITANQANSEVYTSNLEAKGNVTISSSTKWHGGKFTGTTDTHSVQIAGTSTVDNIFSTVNISVIVNGTLTRAVVKYTGSSHYGINVDASANDTDSPTVTDSYVYSLSTVALYAIAYNPTGVITVANITAVSDGSNGAVLHGGNADDGGGLFATNIIAKSSATAGALVVSNKDVSGSVSNTRWGVSKISGYSTAGPGINCINANLKHCFAFSTSTEAIRIGGSDNNSYNLNIIDCVGESLAGAGIKTARDTFIVGGTYISRLNNSSTGSPIHLTAPVLVIPQTLNYYVAGSKTIATNTSAFAIKGDGIVSARISGCQFLNENMASSVLGIQPYSAGVSGVDLVASNMDSYGNVR